MDLCGELVSSRCWLSPPTDSLDVPREEGSSSSPLCGLTWDKGRDGTGRTLCCRAAAASHQFAGREKKQRQSRASAAGRETQLPAISWRLNPSISAHLGPGGLRC